MKKTEYLKFTTIYFLVSFSIILVLLFNLETNLIEVNQITYNINISLVFLKRVFIIITIFLGSFLFTEKFLLLKVSSMKKIFSILIPSCFLPQVLYFVVYFIFNNISKKTEINNNVSFRLLGESISPYFFQNLIFETFIIPLIAVIVSSFLLSKRK